MGITKLYGDYWLSYPISFITKERIIIEPLYTNYNPYYLPLIKKDNKGNKLEPIEEITIDLEEEFSSKIIDSMNKRKGKLIDLKDTGQKNRN